MLTLSLIFIIIFFILSAFFSGIETGLTSIDRIKLEQDISTDGKQKRIMEFLKNPDRIFGTTLFGTNISLVIISTLSMLMIEHLKERKIVHISEHKTTLIISCLVLIFAEIIPKALFRDHPNKLVAKYIAPLKFFSILLKPFVKFVEALNIFLAKLFKLNDPDSYHLISREDISFLVSDTKNEMHEKQREMIQEALEFGDLKAENVMIHRTEIVAFQKNARVEEIIETARNKGFTRFPVYNENLDDIIGILIIYDLLKDRTKNCAEDYMRHAFIIPETMKVHTVLTEMQKNKKSMAIVIDSFGGTAGIITIEDILEEIVGEIEDEYDVTESTAEVQIIDENTYIILGFVEIDFLNDEYELNLPIGDYETVAGMIIDKLARIPQVKTVLKIANWDIEILQATNNKISKLKFSKLDKHK